MGKAGNCKIAPAVRGGRLYFRVRWTQNAPSMHERHDRAWMRDSGSRPGWRAVALVVLTTVGLLAGCDRNPSDKAQAAEPVRAAGTPVAEPSTRPAATQASQPGPAAAARDYVLNPQVWPRETDAGPKRIISTAPSLTELCFALGLGDRLIGRTQYCLYPPAAQEVEVIGALLDPNLERILALQPDLVLVTGSAGVLKEKFDALKLPVVVVPDSSLDDVFEAITQLGEAVHRPVTAARLKTRLLADLDHLQDRAHRNLKIAQGVLLVTGALPGEPRSMWVAGPGSYLDTLLTRFAGAKNAVRGDRAWLEISVEQVLWLRPEVIVEVREAATQVALRQQAVAAWRKLPGLGGVRVVTLTDPAVLVPGPRVNVMLQELIDGLCGKGIAED